MNTDNKVIVDTHKANANQMINEWMDDNMDNIENIQTFMMILKGMTTLNKQCIPVTEDIDDSDIDDSDIDDSDSEYEHDESDAETEDESDAETEDESDAETEDESDAETEDESDAETEDESDAESKDEDREETEYAKQYKARTDQLIAESSMVEYDYEDPEYTYVTLVASNGDEYIRRLQYDAEYEQEMKVYRLHKRKEYNFPLKYVDEYFNGDYCEDFEHEIEMTYNEDSESEDEYECEYEDECETEDEGEPQ